MTRPTVAANPFELMLNPEVIFAAIERSERLGRLKSRICRPLDGPRPTTVADESTVADAAATATPASTFAAAPDAHVEAYESSIDALRGDDDTPADFGIGA